MTDKVTPEEREFVLRRDGECVLFKRDPSHRCSFMGTEHRPGDIKRLTMEHVKDAPMMGKRAPSDRKHMVALCLDANVRVPSRVEREWMRAYLAEMNP